MVSILILIILFFVIHFYIVCHTFKFLLFVLNGPPHLGLQRNVHCYCGFAPLQIHLLLLWVYLVPVCQVEHYIDIACKPPHTLPLAFHIKALHRVVRLHGRLKLLTLKRNIQNLINFHVNVVSILEKMFHRRILVNFEVQRVVFLVVFVLGSEFGTASGTYPVIIKLFQFEPTDFFENFEEKTCRDTGWGRVVKLSDDSLKVALINHRLNHVHDELAFLIGHLIVLELCWVGETVGRRNYRIPLNSMFHFLLETIYCFHYMVAIQKNPTFLNFVVVTQTLSDSEKKPKIIRCLFNGLATKKVKGKTGGEVLVCPMSVF